MPNSTAPSTPQTSHIIRLVRDAGFLNFVAWPPSDDGHKNTVFVADFNLEGSVVQAYCKLYPNESGSNRGLVNEATGYLCASALALPQPKHAFFAQIPVARLPDAPAWLTQSGKSLYPAFCTSRIDGRAAGVRIAHMADRPMVIADIAAWKHLPGAVALDESIAHVDRHLNNLLRLGKADYALIDNGRLVNQLAERWTAEMLDASKLYDNKLCSAVWRNSPERSSISQTIDISRSHPEAYAKIADELDYWLGLLLQSEDHSNFRAFLHARMNGAEQLIRKRFGWLL